MIDFCLYWTKLIDMRNDNSRRVLSSLLKPVIIALVLYFSQIYPYLHFHHAHEQSDTLVEVSIRPADVQPAVALHGHDPEDFPHKSGHSHDHHHEFDQHVDWHVARTYSSRVLSHVDFAFASVQLDLEAARARSVRCHRIDSTPAPESVPLGGIDARGPPVIGHTLSA